MGGAAPEATVNRFPENADSSTTDRNREVAKAERLVKERDLLEAKEARHQAQEVTDAKCVVDRRAAAATRRRRRGQHPRDRPGPHSALHRNCVVAEGADSMMWIQT